MAIAPLAPLPLTARRATRHDIPAVAALIAHWAAQGQMLRKTAAEIARDIADFWVAEEAGKVIGCGALRIYSPDLAEICSLAIAPEARGRGLGADLVQRGLEEAWARGIGRVFALTYQVKFFGRLGFRVIDKADLPAKIWRDCVNCPRQDHCDETAMIIER